MTSTVRLLKNGAPYWQETAPTLEGQHYGSSGPFDRRLAQPIISLDSKESSFASFRGWFEVLASIGEHSRELNPDVFGLECVAMYSFIYFGTVYIRS